MLSKVIQHVIIACIALHSNDTANPTIELNKRQLSARSNWKGYGGKRMVCFSVLNMDVNVGPRSCLKY